MRLQFVWNSTNFCQGSSREGGEAHSDVDRARRNEGAESGKGRGLEGVELNWE